MPYGLARDIWTLAGPKKGRGAEDPWGPVTSENTLMMSDPYRNTRNSLWVPK